MKGVFAVVAVVAGTACTSSVVRMTDEEPALGIDDVTVTEGAGGASTDATFTVTLSAVSGQEVSVGYTTTGGTAEDENGEGDYDSATGTLVIPSGFVSGTITVTVNDDARIEPNETFTVDLSAPTDATIADGSGLGTITDDDGPTETEYAIPAASDFTDQGFIVLPGSGGSWDARVHGMISPVGIVRVGADLVLYYVGADGDRADGGPAHRKLGAAILADGEDETADWTKASENPLVAHNPNPGDANENEEGVFSGGVYFDGSTVEVVFGGMEIVGGSSVDGDGVRVSLGSDGLTAGSQTLVINASDGSVWGSGDEIFPFGLYEDTDGTWWAMYTAKNATGESWHLGWASGNSPTSLTTTQEISEVSGVAYTGSDPIQIGNGKVIFTLFRDSTGDIEIWQGIDASLPSIGSLVRTWSFAGLAPVTGQSMSGVALHLDISRGLWLLAYVDSSFTGIGLKTAPAVRASGGNP